MLQGRRSGPQELSSFTGRSVAIMTPVQVELIIQQCEGTCAVPFPAYNTIARSKPDGIDNPRSQGPNFLHFIFANYPNKKIQSGFKRWKNSWQ